MDETQFGSLIQSNREQLQAAAKTSAQEFAPTLDKLGERLESSSRSLSRATWALVGVTFLLALAAFLNLLGNSALL